MHSILHTQHCIRYCTPILRGHVVFHAADGALLYSMPQFHDDCTRTCVTHVAAGERAAILAVDRRIDLDDLAIRQSPSTTAQITLPEEDVDFDEEMENFERRLILHAYEKSAKVKARTAKMLGIDRNRLRYKLKKYGIDD